LERSGCAVGAPGGGANADCTFGTGGGIFERSGCAKGLGLLAAATGGGILLRSGCTLDVPGAGCAVVAWELGLLAVITGGGILERSGCAKPATGAGGGNFVRSGPDPNTAPGGGNRLFWPLLAAFLGTGYYRCLLCTAIVVCGRGGGGGRDSAERSGPHMRAHASRPAGPGALNRSWRTIRTALLVRPR